MKKIISVFAACFLAASLFISCSKKEILSPDSLNIAMITDSGDISDQSYNQTTYEACKEYAEANNLAFKYYKPADDSTEARIASIDIAIQEGYNAIVMPGYLFAEAFVKVVDENPDITFIGLDISEFDLANAAKDLDKENWKLPSNAFSALYAEEIPGFFAGYAAVKEGYRHLGFLGGLAIPAITRFGYGFIQGCNKAAEEMGITEDVTLEYVYGGQFYGDQAITAAMDGWYQLRGVEIVFSCGGAIVISACEAAAKTNGKVIGVDIDQSNQINKYGAGMCVTSAVKGLNPTVKACLKSVQNKTFASEFGSKISILGLVSGTDVEKNFVGLPTETWSMKNFTVEDYKALVNDVFSGKIKISSNIDNPPEYTIKANAYPNIK